MCKSIAVLTHKSVRGLISLKLFLASVFNCDIPFTTMFWRINCIIGWENPGLIHLYQALKDFTANVSSIYHILKSTFFTHIQYDTNFFNVPIDTSWWTNTTRKDLC